MMDNTRGMIAAALKWVNKYLLFVECLLICVLNISSVVIADAVKEGTNPWGHTVINKNETYQCKEAYMDNLVRELANAYSNFSLFFVGLYFILAAFIDAQNCRTDGPLASSAFQVQVSCLFVIFFL